VIGVQQQQQQQSNLW